MDLILAIILILVMGLLFVGTFVALAIDTLIDKSRKLSRPRRVLRFCTACAVSYGGLAFLSSALAAVGGLPFWASREWPAGYAGGVVRDSAGRYIVPQSYSGRIQVYDHQRRFVRGWFVPSGGGALTVRVISGDRIEASTARKQGRFLYSGDGTLVESGTYAPRSYPDMEPTHSEWVRFPTPLFLWPFSNPFIAWGLGLLGMIGLGFAEGKRRCAAVPRKKNRTAKDAKIKDHESHE